MNALYKLLIATARFRFKPLSVCMVFLIAMISTSSFSRTTSDLKRDKTSKPEEIIVFSEVKSGQSILDLFGGGGYYSELLSSQVGEKGQVVLHNNQAYLPYVGKDLGQRMAGGRLKNVKQLMSEAQSLKLGDKVFDSAFFILGYHDLYVSSKDWQVTAELVISQLYKALKPGGRLLIVDHSAKVGQGEKDAQTLHRIEADFVITDLAKFGFKLIKQSDLLVNKADPLTISVFDSQIRRNTDRFVLLFEKGEKP